MLVTELLGEKPQVYRRGVKINGAAPLPISEPHPVYLEMASAR